MVKGGSGRLIFLGNTAKRLTLRGRPGGVSRDTLLGVLPRVLELGGVKLKKGGGAGAGTGIIIGRKGARRGREMSPARGSNDTSMLSGKTCRSREDRHKKGFLAGRAMSKETGKKGWPLRGKGAEYHST